MRWKNKDNWVRLTSVGMVLFYVDTHKMDLSVANNSPSELAQLTNVSQPVRKIDWSNSNINRAGIIPIYYDGMYSWIGLAISRSSGNISTIGGRFEPDDHDLLSTAIREYSEEVGTNMRSLIEESVYNCYAIMSRYSVAIFVPMVGRPDAFNPTEEVYDLLWLTPKQLRIMAVNQEMVLNKGPRIFLFASDLRLMAKEIADAVDTGQPFTYISSNDSFDRSVRPKKEVKVDIPKIITDINEFKQEVNSFRLGNVGLVIGTDNIIIMREDKTAYVLPKKSSNEKIINDVFTRTGSKIQVAIDQDINDPFLKNMFLKRGQLRSIQYDISKIAPGLMKEFIKQLNIIRMKSEADRIVSEANLIMEYELKVYEASQQKGSFFSEPRACFLRGMSIINNLLSKAPGRVMTYVRMVEQASRQYNCKYPKIHVVINIMLEKRLLDQNVRTTELYIL